MGFHVDRWICMDGMDLMVMDSMGTDAYGMYGFNGNGWIGFEEDGWIYMDGMDSMGTDGYVCMEWIWYKGIRFDGDR